MTTTALAFFYTGPPILGQWVHVGTCRIPPRQSGLTTLTPQFHTLYVCPQCGTPWGHRVIHEPQDVHRWETRLRPCAAHNGGNFFEDVPLHHDCNLTMSPDLLHYEWQTLINRLDHGA